jgi:hypothetical protein
VVRLVSTNTENQPYLFVSAGSGAGAGFIYLDWIIVTYGVPYVVNYLKKLQKLTRGIVPLLYKNIVVKRGTSNISIYSIWNYCSIRLY